MDNIDRKEKSKAYLKWIENPRVKILVGLFFALIGFFVSMWIQNRQSGAANQVLAELLQASENITSDQLETVLNALNSSNFLNNFVYAFLSYFFGSSLMNFFVPFEPPKEISEATIHYDIQDGVIEDLLHHLTDQVYNRCSHTSEHCAGCEKFSSECDGLLRRYLYEESMHLQLSINKSKDGQYVLDNDIPKFHTIAIDHLLGVCGNQYSVIQFIGSKPYSDSHLYDETYDSLDFDFLHTLLSKIMSKSPDGKAYYEKTLDGGRSFKIKWLLIGTSECMQNNFDYIFFVIKSLPFANAENIVSTFFDFYIIDEDKYKRETNLILRKYSSDICNRFFSLANEPSFGIFGDQFMFVDSPDQGPHGTIYTRTYNPDRSAKNVLDMSIEIFAEILPHAESVTFSSFLNRYNDIITKTAGWKAHLQTIWNNNKGETGV